MTMTTDSRPSPAMFARQDAHPIPTTTKRMTVSPARAKAWLKRLDPNRPNRNLREASVSAYARDMMTGHWIYTGDSIKFSTDGVLVDGQHRLSAVVEADTPVEFLVVVGLDRAAQTVMDSGMARTAADALNMSGEKNAMVLGAAIRLAIIWERGEAGNRLRVTKSEHASWLAQNPDMREAVNAVTGMRTKTGVSAAVLSVAYWMLRRVDADDADTFFATWRDSATYGPGDPILALINRIRSAKTSKERLSQTDYLSMIVRAWNAHRRHEDLRKLAVRDRDKNPIPVPAAI